MPLEIKGQMHAGRVCESRKAEVDRCVLESQSRALHQSPVANLYIRMRTIQKTSPMT